MTDCKTKYPIVLVHGLHARPQGEPSSFGRIPDDLRKHGATVFTTEQDAVGTIAENAAQLVQEFEDIRAETGAEKLNIIAHSKGGLESRCAISAYGYGKHVASLSMLSTPNRGLYTISQMAHSPFFDVLSLPVNLWWHTKGDDHPDFAAAARSLTAGALSVFNQQHPDDPRVYYQSWGAVLDDSKNDPLMSAVGLVFSRLDEATDGMVSPESAAWGNYRGTLHGVSHQEFCDLHRRDPDGFDICAFFRTLVFELAQKGF